MGIIVVSLTCTEYLIRLLSQRKKYRGQYYQKNISFQPLPLHPILKLYYNGTTLNFEL